MNSINPKVDFYFDKAQPWQAAIRQLRSIVLDCHLEEVLKWGCPCYTFKGSNIVLIHVFKDYCALLFFKGALMKDPAHILIQQTAQVQAARQVRFTHTDTIAQQQEAIKAYIFEAVALEEAGAKVTLKKTEAYAVPEALQQQLDALPALKAAFEALTPGRQRAYLLYFGQPKQLKTREARVAKCIPQILEGKGLND